jgi:hypothetical protein
MLDIARREEARRKGIRLINVPPAFDSSLMTARSLL